jgi:4'-phosphopantetheinyl transferase
MNLYEQPAIQAVTACLWYAPASCGEPGEIETICESFLDEDDLQRAASFRRPTTRNQHVIGRGMARRLLTDGFHCPTDVRFQVAEGGKPFAAEPPQARRAFNVAHTEGLVVCGLIDATDEAVAKTPTSFQSHQVPLGVDVERLDRRVDLHLADRYFSAPEIDYLHQLANDDERHVAFLRIWTLKESFIKAIGTGLRTPLDQFAFEGIDDEKPKIRFLNPGLASATGKKGNWHFRCFTPSDGFIASVGVELNHDEHLETRVIDFSTMLKNSADSAANRING